LLIKTMKVSYWLWGQKFLLTKNKKCLIKVKVGHAKQNARYQK
jgi:hypothetical protein